MSPSLKVIMEGLNVSKDTAKQVKAIMDGPGKVDGKTRLERIDKIIGTYGVEYTPRGHNSKSPAILYCNAGDTYTVTVLKINGKFRIGCWGDIVERGNYD